MKAQISRRAVTSGLALASLAPLPTRADEIHCDAELIELDAALARAWKLQDQVEGQGLPGERRDVDLEAAMASTRAIVESILAARAQTLDGLRAKCRALLWCHSGEFEGLAPAPGETFIVSRTTDLQLRDSILRDLLEIALKA
ncbi:MAG TPA: hypothetical protein VIF88_12155 [Methylocystis sp.]|jgi:hypothetical protein